MIKAVVVLSGGQDSVTCLALATKKFGAAQVAAITFEYGQRHTLETKYAKKAVKHFGIQLHKIVKLDFLGELAPSALLLSSGTFKQTKGKNCPDSVVEGRNAFFLTAAAVWAKTLGANALYAGMSETDFSGYPDCRAVFLRSMAKSLSLALDYKIKIVTPLMQLTKADEWMLAERLGIFDYIERDTLTCYNGKPGDGCGKCPACKLRNRGKKEFLAKKSRK